MRHGAVRLVAGAQRGRALAVPVGVRPTALRVREALFSIWADRVGDARVLDLFAGSGAVGGEALSRGALAVDFVEARRGVLGVLRSNLDAFADPARYRILALELPGGLADERLTRGPGYDLVFADPPYAFDALEAVIAALPALLARDGEVVIEHSSRVEPPPCGLRRSRRYGESRLSFYDWRAEATDG